MKTNLPIALGLGLFTAVATSPSLAGSTACTARSPEHAVALLELYTSEGCSSCPPADRWLGSLKAAEALAGKVVPLALHVDYWDYIGWKDAYARPGFAARQRRMAVRAGNPVVYTPQFFLQGKPYRPPASPASLATDLEAIEKRPPQADIALSLEPVANGSLTVKLTARLRESRAAGSAGLFVALYENGLSTPVKAGENRGATLHHDFVVRGWIGPRPLPATGGSEQEIRFALAPDWQIRNLGVAVFIQDARNNEVLQALSQPLCG